ncbi:phosphatidate cytidylyltransferase [Desulfuromusa kysingii]|uniref:Phosphatidate cytidylyltransferase n=2 Tax=Desulfuromusa kysingii TaxID=37625 RepID=A0A1H3Y9R3_9BACT|nr:phosphatidate cytidylyltransferase [Desulfuromusa kysingii]
MSLGDEHGLEQWLAAISGAAVIPMLLYGNIALLLPLYTATMILLAILFLFRLPELTVVHYRLGWIVLGLVYLPFLFSHLMLLRLLPEGRQWIFMTLIVIMSCDSFAYFVGRRFGQRKLYPAVSPNKTVEGGLGGLFGSVLAMMVVKFTFLPALGVVDGVFIALLLGVLGQLGDLFESLLKRACQVKDSGNIIPGHGGMLDRLDSLLFTFPVVYYLARYCYGG